MSAGLEIERVSHAYGGVPAVRELSLTVGHGDIACLLGPSGCGKSTTLRLIAGLEPLQQGRIVIDGQLVAGGAVMLPPERRNVGLVFQDYALFPHLRVLDNVAFGLSGPVERRRARSLEMLRRVGLADAAGTWPHMLSGGEQQRVALARALAPQPGLMLMDEPFSGLDIRLRDTVRDDTIALLKSTGTAALLVTHDPEEAMRMGDHIAVMRSGRIVQQGAPSELYDQPRDGFVARFFGEINEFCATVRGGAVSTPLGRLPAPDLAEGSRADVLIRPEALLVRAPDMDGIAATVRLGRSLGPYGLVRLHVQGFERELLARIPGGVPPAAGAVVSVSLVADLREVFVFAAESA